MAEEELVPEGDEALTDAPEIAEQQPDPIADLAGKMGWKPQDQWQGEPEAWKPADEFILAGREIQQTTSRSNRDLTDRLERIERTAAQILQDKLAERDAEWKARLAQATEDGDTATVLRLTEERPQAPPQRNGTDPTTQRWIAENPWFDTHPRAKALAIETSERLSKLGIDTATQLKEAEAEVRQRYPELFGTQAKPPPATQTATNRNAQPSNRIKGYADMPQESQRVALDFERLNGVPKEDFAKQYWANEAKKRVRA